MSLAGPAAGILAYRLWPRFPRTVRRLFILLLACICTLAIAVALGPLSFRGITTDAVLIGLGYISVCVLNIVAIRRNPRQLKLPMALSVASGTLIIFLFVFSELDFSFTVGSVIPIRESTVSPDLTLRVAGQEGLVKALHSADVELISHPWPGLELIRYRRSVPSAQCDAARLQVSIRGQQGELLCGRTRLEPFRLQ